jgi:signal transduction histidine kinase
MAKHPQPERPVRRSLILSALVITAVPLGIVTWQQYRTLSTALSRQANDVLVTTAQTLAARADGLMNARLDHVRLAARNTALVDALNGRREASEAQAALRALVGLDAVHNTVAALVDRRRQLVVSTAPLGSQGEPNTRELPFPIVLAVPDDSGRVSEIAFLASVRSVTGQQLGILGLRTRGTALSQLLAEVGNSSTGTLLRIRQNTGALVAAWPLPREGKLRPSPQTWEGLPADAQLLDEGIRSNGIRERRYRHAAGGSVMREASIGLASVPWYVTITRDEAEVLGPANRALRRSVGFSLAVMLVVGWLAALLGGRFATRIEALARVVRRIASGDRTVPTMAHVPAGDEIDQLSDDVSLMATEIEALVVRLEERSQQLEAELNGRAMLEERLLEARRLEAVGLVAGMVAHDFNNVLTIVRGAAETARDSIAADHSAHEDLREVVLASERGAAMTRRMLAVAKRNGETPRRFDANDMVRDCARLLERLVPNGVVRVHADSEHAWVHIDGTSLLQCLMNLVSNARDAADGYRAEVDITVSRTVDESFPLLGGESLPVGEYVAIAVKDNGSGIADDVLLRLSEPFFTTKTGLKGTGLGLASVASTCREVGGALAVRSALGAGSTFTILLPYAGTAPNPVVAPAKALAPN